MRISLFGSLLIFSLAGLCEGEETESTAFKWSGIFDPVLGASASTAIAGETKKGGQSDYEYKFGTMMVVGLAAVFGAMLILLLLCCLHSCCWRRQQKKANFYVEVPPDPEASHDDQSTELGDVSGDKGDKSDDKSKRKNDDDSDDDLTEKRGRAKKSRDNDSDSGSDDSYNDSDSHSDSHQDSDNSSDGDNFNY